MARIQHPALGAGVGGALIAGCFHYLTLNGKDIEHPFVVSAVVGIPAGVLCAIFAERAYYRGKRDVWGEDESEAFLRDMKAVTTGVDMPIPKADALAKLARAIQLLKEIESEALSPADRKTACHNTAAALDEVRTLIQGLKA